MVVFFRFCQLCFGGWWVDDRMFIRCFCFSPINSIFHRNGMYIVPWYLSFYLFLLFVFYFHGYYTNGRIEVLYQQSIEPCVAGISKSKYQKRKALNKQLGKLEWNDATTDIQQTKNGPCSRGSTKQILWKCMKYRIPRHPWLLLTPTTRNARSVGGEI